MVGYIRLPACLTYAHADDDRANAKEGGNDFFDLVAVVVVEESESESLRTNPCYLCIDWKLERSRFFCKKQSQQKMYCLYSVLPICTFSLGFAERFTLSLNHLCT